MKKRTRLEPWRVILGALLTLSGWAGLAISGVIALNQTGYMTWSGWVNLAAVFAGSLALAWVLRTRGTGLALPSTPPNHLLAEEAAIWKTLADWVRDLPLDSLQDPASRSAHWKSLESILFHAPLSEKKTDGPSLPSWRDLTLAECAAAARVAQSRLDAEVRQLAGPMLDIPLGDWRQGWRAWRWVWKLAPLAWIPGLLLAPWEALARWTITILGPDRITQSAGNRVREDISRRLLLVVVDALLELRGRRLRAGADIWLESHPQPSNNTIRSRITIPWLSILLAGTLSLVPWLGISILGFFFMGANHIVWLLACLIMIGLGLFLLLRAARKIWQMIPKKKPDGSEERSQRGQLACEHWLEEHLADGTLPGADAGAWMETMVEIDQVVRKAEGHQANEGWDHLTPREILSWAHSQAGGLETVLRDRIPGSLHLRLGDWLAAANWAGLNPDTAPPPEEPMIANGIFDWWKNLREKVVTGIKRKVENVAGATLVRHASAGLSGLHAHSFAGMADPEPKSGFPGPTGSAPSLRIIFTGQSGAGKSTLLNELRPHFPSHYKVDWLDSPAFEASIATTPKHAGTIIDAVAKILATADLVVLVWHAKTAARGSDLELLRKWMMELGKCKRPGVPCLVALSHVDLLHPTREWQPPYVWKNGSRPKEISIFMAVGETKKLLDSEKQNGLVITCRGVVPVAVVDGVAWNLQEELLPALRKEVDSARNSVWNRWISLAGKPGWRELASQAKNAGKWLWPRI